MERQAVENVVHGLYEVRLANDVAATRALFTDDAEVKLAGAADDPSLNAAGPTGAAELDSLIEVLVTTWTWHKMEIEALVINGDQAALRYTLDVTHNPTGERLTTELSDHIQIRGDKISSFVEFVDTGTVERLSAQAAGN